MFKKDEFSSSRENGEGATIIAEGVKVEGNFISKGNVLVEGTLKGSVKTEQNLRVGERAKIIANVVAANVTVAGEIQGTLKVSGQLELLPTSRVSGDVESKTLIVAAGACLNGKCMMSEAGSQEQLLTKSRNGNGKDKETQT